MHPQIQLGNTAAQSVSAAGSVGTAAISSAAGAGAISAATAAIAIPVIGAAVAGVTIWLSTIARKNAQKSASTAVMYEIQEQAQKNLDGYLQGPRTVSSQRVALQNIDQLIAILKSPQGCGNPDLGSAGERCWKERATPEGPYSWYGYFRDPIAHDTPQPDPPGVLASAGQTLSTFADTFLGAFAGTENPLLAQWPLFAAIGLVAIAFSE